MSSQKLPGNPERVGVYVDGFNLYYGLKAANLGHARWLDLTALSRNILRPNQQLVKVKYFTARVKGPDKGIRGRQSTYLQALETRDDLEIIYGRFMRKNDGVCHKCGHRWASWEEKMTDVNIAAHLAIDVTSGVIDKALLVSGDSDLAHAVQLVKSSSSVKVIAVFPPKRSSFDLKKVVDFSMSLNRTIILKSVMEDPVKGPSGDLQCPPAWK